MKNILNKRIIVEIVLMVCFVFTGYTISVKYNLHAMFESEFAEKRVNEIIIVFLCIIISFVIFIFRRWQDVSRELLLRMKAELHVENLNKQINFILGATKTGLDIIDRDYNVRYIDPEWQKIYGDPKGKKCYQYFMDINEICAGCGVKQAFDTRKMIVTEEVLKKENNRVVQVTTIPFQTNTGEWLVAEVNVDIRDRKNLESALEKSYKNVQEMVDIRTMELNMRNEQLQNEIAARKKIQQELEFSNRELEETLWKLERAIRVKTDFTAMVSHELRTPLASIRESLSLVLDHTAGSINEEQNELMQIAKRNVDRLANLINNVLDFQRMESGKLEYNIKENDINLAVKEVYKMMHQLAKDKGLQFEIRIEDKVCLLRFDNYRIIQVLVNFVGNAIKFTEKGSVIVSTKFYGKDVYGRDKLSQNDLPEEFVLVSVQDTGIGIKKENIPELFDRYAQVGEMTERKTGGSGLGLAISKNIIDAHRGKIWVESEFGKGSVFYFVLPVR
jgi:signal transduction histidine kinase